MSEDSLVRLFEHNNWANLQIIRACQALSDEQLDAEPHSATMGSIRATLTHLVRSQRGYLALLTLPIEDRPTSTPPFDKLEQVASDSGAGLLALAKGELRPMGTQLQTTSGYRAEPWVVMVQVINHATEHREQIKSMLSALGVTPPDVDSWHYGLATNALVPNPA